MNVWNQHARMQLKEEDEMITDRNGRTWHEMGIGLVSAGDPVISRYGQYLPCPMSKCPGHIVYNGNYYCSAYDERKCLWSLSDQGFHSLRDRYIEKLLGIGYATRAAEQLEPPVDERPTSLDDLDQEETH